MNRCENILVRMEKDRQGERIPVVLKAFVISACIVADFVTFYTLFKIFLPESELMYNFLSGTCALTINLFPMLISYILSRRNLSRQERAMVSAFAVAFLMTLGIYFAIRMYGRAEFFFEAASMESDKVALEAEEVTVTAAQTALTALIGIMPLLTSLVCFGLTYTDARRAYVNTLKNQLVELRNEIVNTEVSINLLNQELERQKLEEYDERRYQACVDSVQLVGHYAQIAARRVLAQKIGTADAVTRLMEENSLKKSVSALI